MLTAITYNCNPESLGDITPEDFVDAFEAEVVALPQYRNTLVEVTFKNTRSHVATYATDSLDVDNYESFDDRLRTEFEQIAERTFNACLAAE